MKKLNLSYVAAFVLFGSVLSTGNLKGSDNNKANDGIVMNINEDIALSVDSVFVNREEVSSLNLLSLIKPIDNKDLRTVFTQEISYPVVALEANREGVVKVQFSVGPNGHISEVNVVEKADDTLADEVTDAVKKLRLQPIIQNGIPVSYRLLLSVRFELI